MIGEFCREAGVLVFVFANVDLWLYHTQDDWGVVVHVLEATGAAAAFMVTGILMEKWRRQ